MLVTEPGIVTESMLLFENAPEAMEVMPEGIVKDTMCEHPENAPEAMEPEAMDTLVFPLGTTNSEEPLYRQPSEDQYEPPEADMLVSEGHPENAP